MRAGYSKDELKEFYNYTYEVHRDKNEVCISILSKEDGKEIAIVSR